jgi:hypothetical protein
MVDQSDAGRITMRFNLALFAFCAAVGVINFLVSSDKAKGVPLEGLVLSIALDALLVAAVILIAACFAKEFWNRLISSLFSIRPINYQEAISIVLLVSILFATRGCGRA